MILVLGGTTEGRIAVQTLEESPSIIQPRAMNKKFLCITASACKVAWIKIVWSLSAVKRTSRC